MLKKIQYTQVQNVKKQTDTNSEKSKYSDSFSNKHSISKPNIKFTTFNRITEYFQSYQQNTKLNLIEIRSNDANKVDQSQFKSLVNNLKFQKLKKTSGKKNKQFQQQLNKNSINILQSYQLHQRQKLQNKLFQSGRFKKTNTFTSELLIHDLIPSKNYEIVKLGVQLLWYKTQILILNDLQKNIFTSTCHVSDSGSFGLIYFVNILDEQLAIKCISLSNEQNPKDHQYKSQILSYAIKEYFFLLLFSELQIGPKTKKLSGFDIILNDDFIQFAAQICQVPTIENQDIFSEEMRENLFKMHMLQIVHRDIKPSNIMYSPTFQKYVFIDFGCSDALQESLGIKSLTKFTGATAFCSDQMFSLLSSKVGHVDLYFNDVFALKKSFDFSFNFSQAESEIKTVKSLTFQLYKMKQNLYQGNYDEFHKTWNQVSIKYIDQIDEVQIKIMEFLKDLKITSQLRQFYWNQINQNIKQMNEFQKINKLMKNHSFDLISEIISYPKKQRLFEQFQILYKILKIQYGDQTQEQIQIESILVSKEKIHLYLTQLQIKFEIDEKYVLDEFQTVKLNLVTVFYVTFAENKYQASAQEKVTTCQFVNEILKINDDNNKQIVEGSYFKCGDEKLCPISYFYENFLTKYWKKVPSKYYQKSSLNSIITLLLIGSPFNLTRFAKCFYDIKNQPLVDKNKKNTKYPLSRQKNQKSQKSLQKQKKWRQQLNKICLFWQFELVLIIFQNMFTNQRTIEFNQSIVNYVHKFQETSLSNDKYNKVFQVNKRFYQELIVNYKNFNEISFDLLLAELQSTQIVQLQKISLQVKKWRSLLQIILCCFVFVYCSNCPVQILMSLSNQMIFSHWDKDNIFPYGICLFLYKGTNFQTETQIIQKISHIIHCKQISLRFCLIRKLRLSLEKMDLEGIQEITQLLKRQIVVQNFLIVNNSQFFTLIRIIKHFFVNYVKSLSMLSLQSLTLLKKCQGIIQLAWQIGLNQKHVSSVKKIQQTPDQLITTQLIEHIIKKDQICFAFYSYLLSLGEIYVIVSRALNQKNKIFQIDQKYLTFFQWISQNRKTFSFASQWLKIIKKHPKIKQIMRSNRLLLISFINFYFQDRRTITQIENGQQIISQLFEQIVPDNFFISSNKKNLPSFQVAFDYLQIKLVKTKYDPNECEKMIELYKTCVQKNCFSVVCEKHGLIRYIFNSFIYAEKSFEQIRQYLQYMSKSITVLPKKIMVRNLLLQLQRWFWCQCETCFPRKPQNWNPELFNEYLYKTIHLLNPAENPYMALIYFYSMNKKRLKPQVLQKFIKYILRSVHLLSPLAQHLIHGRMYFYVQVGFHSQDQEILFLDRNSKDMFKKLRFSKQQRNLSIHRRIFHSYFMFIKSQLNQYENSQILAQKLFIKQFYFYDYKYPPLIRKMYKKKLMRYFEVRQNYKKNPIIENIIFSQRIPYLQSMKNHYNY